MPKPISIILQKKKEKKRKDSMLIWTFYLIRGKLSYKFHAGEARAERLVGNETLTIYMKHKIYATETEYFLLDHSREGANKTPLHFMSFEFGYFFYTKYPNLFFHLLYILYIHLSKENQSL
jgi:hypothetical protein